MSSEPRRQAREAALRRASRTLSELVDRDPLAAALLESDSPLPDRATYEEVIRSRAAEGGLPELRLEKRRRLLEIAARDVSGELSVEVATAALADLADACLQVTLEHLEAAETLAVIGMGKLGGRELNYVSDIDVMFLTEGDVSAATKLAERLLRTLGEYSPEGRAFIIDTNLRPEGRSGALVRSLEGYLEYYRKWAKPWEYQALIKARPVAGNTELGQKLIDSTRAYAFSVEVSPERIASIRKMKRRVEDHVARGSHRGHGRETLDVKLGPGGIRDIEFCVQLLQLVHGGSDESVRDISTLDALANLTEGGYVAEEDGAGLSVAYRWLRTVEHRLQLWQERRVHRLPTDERSKTGIAHTLGFDATPLKSASQRFEEAHQSVLVDVRHRFERIFYRPMIESLSEGTGRKLSREALQERLRVLGFRDVERAARNLEGLVVGTSRRTKLFRVLMPALLRFLAGTPSPDEGLLSFLRLGEALGDRVEVWGSFRENPPGLKFLAEVLGSGRLLGEVLSHVPEELQAIADPGELNEPKDRERLTHEVVASLEWREPRSRIDGLRRFKRREMLRVALADLGNRCDQRAVGSALADLAEACLEAALQDCDVPFAVIGMGKLGGRELQFASDVDVMFVYDGDHEVADKVATRLLRTVGEITPEGQAFRVDAALRPEGKSGPLVRSLDSYVEYYERWAKDWEHQALIKARWAAGDAALGEKLLNAVRPFAFPEQLREEALVEMRHLKARMEKERVVRGSDPRLDFKMGPGGLSDIEFTAQVFQRTYGHDNEELQVVGTVEALEAANSLGLIENNDVHVLVDAYGFLMRLRNRAFLLASKPVDVLPTRPEDLEALGIAMGYTEQPRQELEEVFLRTTRRARKIAEKVIYG